MLPMRKPASPASPSSSQEIWIYEPHRVLDSSVVPDLEVNSLRALKSDAEASGPHAIEMETVKSLSQLEIGPQRRVDE